MSRAWRIANDAFATRKAADTAPAVPYEPVREDTSSTIPRLIIAIGIRASNPPTEKTQAPGMLSTRRYDANAAATSLTAFVLPSVDRCIVEQGVVEESDHATLVLLRMGLESPDVLNVVHRPDLRRRTDQALVERVHGLAVAAVRRPDEEGGPGRDPRHQVDQAGGRQLVGEQRDPRLLGDHRVEAAQQRRAVVLHHLLLDGASAGTFGDHRGEALVLRRRLQHQLAADREAET